MVDKAYCMSSYLALRTVADHTKRFADNIEPVYYDNRFARKTVCSSEELERELKHNVQETVAAGKTALALSGGIDSAILARFMPKGAVAYTFRCVVPGVAVTDETDAASVFAKECGLEQRIVEIDWHDIEQYAPELMKRKGMPIHSIEVQIYKACQRARDDGFEYILFGESADVNYGGHSGLLSRDWTIGEFIDRYSYVKPYYALRQAVMPINQFEHYMQDGYVDVHNFNRNVYFVESMGSYTNACDLAGIAFEAPYARTYMGKSLDLQRVRNGENKYWIREIFQRLYPNFAAREKLPMPRPTNEWLKNWTGPVRSEFWPHCTDHMTGDQKWLVYCLEWFLNLMDKGELSNGKI